MTTWSWSCLYTTHNRPGLSFKTTYPLPLLFPQLQLCVITATDQAAPIAGFLFLCNIAINAATTPSHNRYSPSVLVKKFTCFKSILAFLRKIECHQHYYQNWKQRLWKQKMYFFSLHRSNFELASFLRFFRNTEKTHTKKISRKISIKNSSRGS